MYTPVPFDHQRDLDRNNFRPFSTNYTITNNTDNDPQITTQSIKKGKTKDDFIKGITSTQQKMDDFIDRIIIIEGQDGNETDPALQSELKLLNEELNSLYPHLSYLQFRLSMF